MVIALEALCQNHQHVPNLYDGIPNRSFKSLSYNHRRFSIIYNWRNQPLALA
jgi:hypothetical protein